MLSRPENITPVITGILDTDPLSILDVGCGMGKYGLLAREALLSRWVQDDRRGRYDELRVDGVDLGSWPVASWLPAVYDNVWLDTDVTDLLAQGVSETTPPGGSPVGGVAGVGDAPLWWDLVMLNDVLEHWTEGEAEQRVGLLRSHAGRLLVSTPKEVHFYHADPYGEDVPGHVTQWTVGSLADLLGDVEVLSEDPSFVVFTK